jgi:membrane associated rhomboid family serine protease
VIPLRDENPTRRAPIITILLIAACVGVFFFVQPSGQGDVTGESDLEFTFKHAAIPCEIVEGRPLHQDELVSPDACNASDRSPALFPGKQVYLAILFSMFMHAGLLHIAGNMLYFWVFGNNIEDRMGFVPFLVFYLAGGVVATLGHIAVDPDSTIPLVGASGAVAAVMGAYLVLYPKARVHSLLILGFFVLFRPIPAWGLLGFWFVGQFLVDPNSRVAWVAHVAGFVFGVVVGLLMRGRASLGQGRRPPALV